jgi:uncharacterized protein
MFEKVSSFILRYRYFLLFAVIGFTVFMGIQARKVEMSYANAKLLPNKDIASVDYDKFLKTFGQEGNLIVIGTTDDKIFEKDNFNRWSKLCADLKTITGVEGLLSVPNAYQLIKNSEKKKFDLIRIFPDTITSQTELDSLANVFKSIPLYRNYLYNDSTHAHLIALTMNKDKMVSKIREDLVETIKEKCIAFEKESGLEIHYSGLPYIHVMNSILIKKEIYLFTALALAICLIVLFLFFRSFKAMIFPALVVLTGVITALGTLTIFNYKITVLTGMIPPLLIVIGIPNSIFMLNKYHNEYKIHQNKIKALKRVIEKIGNAIFLSNLTTAIGFATFITTSSEILKHFGIIASINILLLFVLSIILIPIIFSFLPPPEERHMKHLQRRTISNIIEKLVVLSQQHRKAVYLAILCLLIISGIGISKMKTTGYMLDDVPEDAPIFVDLKFFEKNFDGLMPLEIIIDTKKPNGILQTSTLKKIEELDNRLHNYSELSSSVSIVNVVKMAKQAFYNGDENYYSLPNSTERNFIMSYVTNAQGDLSLAESFIDSSKQVSRVSIRMKDVGTKRMNELYDIFIKEVHEIFPSDNYDIIVTGSSIVFFRGNQYLVGNLFGSIALAIFLISLFMAAMFNSSRMVLMSLIPNIIPLLAAAAIMGFAGISIKASTLLVFSISFGISVDNTIHFLAKYRQELNATNWNIRKSVIRAIRESGVSMIYTSTVLFFGFGIFSISEFGGIQAMGTLVSLTLLIALLSNLVLLPSLLIGMERIITTKSFHEPLLQIYNEEEDINLDQLEINYENKNEDQ